MNIVLLGAPGVGKGTQAARLAAYLRVPHISTGDILRRKISATADFGATVESAISRGALIPDNTMTMLVRTRLAESDAAEGFVLDGYPRTLEQAHRQDEMFTGRPLSVVEIRTNEAEILYRLSQRRVCNVCGRNSVRHECAAIWCRCGCEFVARPDDRLSVVRQRLHTYAQFTQPVIEHYQQQRLLRTVPGDLSPDEVAERIKEALELEDQRALDATK
jgi:adenylate kinase